MNQQKKGGPLSPVPGIERSQYCCLSKVVNVWDKYSNDETAKTSGASASPDNWYSQMKQENPVCKTGDSPC